MTHLHHKASTVTAYMRVPILHMILLVDFFQHIIIILGIYGTFVWIHGHLHPIFGETMMFPVFFGKVSFACMVFLISLHPWYLSFPDKWLSVCLSSVLDQCKMLDLCSVFQLLCIWDVCHFCTLEHINFSFFLTSVELQCHGIHPCQCRCSLLTFSSKCP